MEAQQSGFASVAVELLTFERGIDDAGLTFEIPKRFRTCPRRNSPAVVPPVPEIMWF